MSEHLFRGGPCNGERIDVPLQGGRLPTTVYVPNPADLNAMRVGWTEDPSAITPTMTTPIQYTKEKVRGGLIEYWSSDYRATAIHALLPVEQRLAMLERAVADAQAQIERLSQ